MSRALAEPPLCKVTFEQAKQKPTRRNWRLFTRRLMDRFKADYQKKLQFDYALDRNAARVPFLVSMIYHDEAFTYIKCAATEKPALYEIKDGRPNLINFQVEHGVYIAPKVIEDGYLVIGSKRATFKRHS